MMKTFLVSVLLFWAGAATAQEDGRTPSHCLAVAQQTDGIEYLVPASLGPVAEETVRICLNAMR